MPAVGTKVMIQFENELASSAIGIFMKRIGHDDIEPMSNTSHKAFTIKESSHLSMTPDQVIKREISKLILLLEKR